MKSLITGNMGYVGPVLGRRLRETYPDAEINGLDMGYFGNCISSNGWAIQRDPSRASALQKNSRYEGIIT